MPPELHVGSTFAGHRIDALAGRGGMGIVYRATDLALDRVVALKLIAPDVAHDPSFRARFGHECRIAAGLDHPHVVEVYSAGEQDGVLYVTMRYVEGTDLGRLLQAERQLEVGRAVGLLAQVASALDEAHGRGLVHRDVKPANVLLARRNGGGEHAYLTDFGLAHDGAGFGTADYAAPEQVRGEPLDGRADVYSTGCVLYEMLAGAPPFHRATAEETVRAHLREAPPAIERDDLPAGFDDVLRRALSKVPDDRHATAGELAAEAADLVEGAVVAAGERLRVVVADDSVLLRTGVVRVLEQQGFEVVAQAGDAEELLAAVREHEPDVAVTDIRMPPTHTDEGLRAAHAIRTELPGTGVLVLSQYSEAQYAHTLFADGRAGIGYLLKERVIDPAAFAEAVRQVWHGEAVLDPTIIERRGG
jgi:serine/threonine-protein kinase